MRVFSNVSENIFRPSFGTSRAPELRTHFCLLSPECGYSRQVSNCHIGTPRKPSKTKAQSIFCADQNVIRHVAVSLRSGGFGSPGHSCDTISWEFFIRRLRRWVTANIIRISRIFALMRPVTVSSRPRKPICKPGLGPPNAMASASLV